MPGTTTFHVIRHGDYPLVGRVIAGQMSGHSLSPLGLSQARAVADGLAAYPVAAVVASPLERTRETAAPIAERLGLDVEIDEDLIEIDYGEWTGRTFAEMRQWEGWPEFSRFRSTRHAPGGESMLDVQLRAVRAVLRWRSAHPDGHVVLVSHGDVVKSIIAHVLTIPLDFFRRFEVSVASRSVVTVSDGDAQVLGLNLPPPARS